MDIFKKNVTEKLLPYGVWIPSLGWREIYKMPMRFYGYLTYAVDFLYQDCHFRIEFEPHTEKWNLYQLEFSKIVTIDHPVRIFVELEDICKYIADFKS